MLQYLISRKVHFFIHYSSCILTLSILNLLLSSLSTTSRESLPQFSTVVDEDDLTWVTIFRNLPCFGKSFICIFLLKPLGFSKIKSVFMYVKWCFNASWGLKRLNTSRTTNTVSHFIRCTSDVFSHIVLNSSWFVYLSVRISKIVSSLTFQLLQFSRWHAGISDLLSYLIVFVFHYREDIALTTLFYLVLYKPWSPNVFFNLNHHKCLCVI